ncbi:MAG: potassium channel protein [Methanococcoides sp.]|nr:potassium channel protein [Methanococcoides sp.]
MKYPNFLRTHMAGYIGISIAVVIIYIFIFIKAMEFEQQFEHTNFHDALYWVVSTITTVGYGDIVFKSVIGKLFSIIVQVSGISMFFGILITLVVTPWFEKTMKLPLPARVPKKMSDHIIVCGYNQLVETLIDEFQEQELDFVILSDDEEVLRSINKKRIPCLYGMASDETTLENANIHSARFLIANMSDRENANITLTARKLSDVRVIAVAEDASNVKYLKYAGADRVISPKLVLGRFIAKKAVDPILGMVSGATEFFDGYRIVELPIYSKSTLVGKTLLQASIENRTGAKVIALRKGGQLTFDIDRNDIIKNNTVILAAGTVEQLAKLENLAG